MKNTIYLINDTETPVVVTCGVQLEFYDNGHWRQIEDRANLDIIRVCETVLVILLPHSMRTMQRDTLLYYPPLVYGLYRIRKPFGMVYTVFRSRQYITRPMPGVFHDVTVEFRVTPQGVKFE